MSGSMLSDIGDYVDNIFEYLEDTSGTVDLDEGYDIGYGTDHYVTIEDVKNYVIQAGFNLQSLRIAADYEVQKLIAEETDFGHISVLIDEESGDTLVNLMTNLAQVYTIPFTETTWDDKDMCTQVVCTLIGLIAINEYIRDL